VIYNQKLFQNINILRTALTYSMITIELEEQELCSFSLIVSPMKELMENCRCCVKLRNDETNYRKCQNRHPKIGVRNMRIVISSPIICTDVRFPTLVSSCYNGASGTYTLLSLLSGEHFVVLSFWNPARCLAGAAKW
jgi:hypothetical protein